LTTSRLLLIALLALCTVAGISCATSSQGPIDNAVTRVALSPERNQITIESRAHQPIGQIVPVDISIANGTSHLVGIHSTQIYGINDKGERIVAVPAGQAIQLAGDVNKLNAGLKGAAAGLGIGAFRNWRFSGRCSRRCPWRRGRRIVRKSCTGSDLRRGDGRRRHGS
jgi:hypothetical protein